MKRPLLVIGGTYAVTAWIAFFFPLEERLLLSLACAVTGVALLLLGRRGLRTLCFICLSGAVALGASCLYDLNLRQPFTHNREDSVLMEGVIIDASHYSNATYYTVVAAYPERPDLPQNKCLSLRVYGSAELLEGELIRCGVKLLPLEETGRERYYLARDILVLGTPTEEPASPEDVSQYRLWRSWVALRQRMLRNITRNLPPETAQVHAAMILGLKSDLDAGVYADLSRAGTVHLLTVSGLHLSILTTLLLRLFHKWRLPRLPRCLLTAVLAFAFAVVVGLSPSIVRAIVMSAMVLLGEAAYRRNDGLNSWGFALLLIGMFAPGWTLSLGLWLSAGSTLGILLYSNRLTKAMKTRLGLSRSRGDRVLGYFVAAAAVTVSASVFTMPILFVANGWGSLLSPIANVLVAPLAVPTIVGGILCAFWEGSGLVLTILSGATQWCTAMVVGISGAIASLPFSVVTLAQGYQLVLAVVIFAALAVLLVCKAPKEHLVYALLVSVICSSVGGLWWSWSTRDKLELVTLESCGTALLIRNSHAVLLGAPDRYEINSVLRYLRFRGIRKVDAVVDGGLGNQVDSGLLRLSEQYPIGCVVGPDDAYILDQLETALPQVPVLSGGYGQVQVLEGAVILPSRDRGEMEILVRGAHVTKTGQEYGIMDQPPAGTVFLFSGGEIAFGPGMEPLWNPVGTHLYGETRLLLDSLS